MWANAGEYMQEQVIEKKIGSYLIARENGNDTGSSNWIGGSASLTTSHLHLAPNAANALIDGKASVRTINLIDVSKVQSEAAGLISVNAGDNIYQFQGFGGKDFANRIELAVSRCRGEDVDTSVRKDVPLRPLAPESAALSLPSPSNAPEAARASALVPCNQCGHPVSPHALACPVCKTSFGDSAAGTVLNQAPPAGIDVNIRERLRAKDVSAEPVSAPRSVALRDCSACGHSIAISAAACPLCGAPNEFVHPLVTAFKSRKFEDAPLFNYEVTGTTINGNSYSAKDKLQLIAFLSCSLATILFFVSPWLASFFLASGVIGMGMWIFVSSHQETFTVDLSQEKPRWSSSNDAFWSSVRNFFVQ